MFGRDLYRAIPAVRRDLKVSFELERPPLFVRSQDQPRILKTYSSPDIPAVLDGLEYHSANFVFCTSFSFTQCFRKKIWVCEKFTKLTTTKIKNGNRSDERVNMNMFCDSHHSKIKCYFVCELRNYKLVNVNLQILLPLDSPIHHQSIRLIQNCRTN